MKRKENLSLKRRNLVVVLLAYVLVISSMLTACGTSTATTTPETKQEVAAVDKEVVQSEVVDEVETESVTEIETEPVTEDVEETEVATYETAMDWAITVDGTTPKLTVWNELTKQGTLLDNGQKYLVKEGDILVLCCSYEGEMSFYMDAPMLSKIQGTSIHKEYEFTEIPSEETTILFELKVGEEEYKLSLIVVSENATATAAEVSESTEVSGKDWASSLSYEEPKLLAWNDETGTKEVIENGGQYTMNEGDVLAIHCPAEHYVTTGSPMEFAKGVTVINNFWRLEYVLPSESQEINLEIEVMNPQQEFMTYNYVITTP